MTKIGQNKEVQKSKLSKNVNTGSLRKISSIFDAVK
jgi:hypothetical protein